MKLSSCRAFVLPKLVFLGANALPCAACATSDPGMRASVRPLEGLSVKQLDGSARSNKATPTAYVVTPEDFGALGDGVTDDRTKINEAAAFVCNRSWGVLLLRRKYAVFSDARLSDPEDNHAYDGQHLLLGCGGRKPTVIQMASGSSLNMLGVGGTSPRDHWQSVYSRRRGRKEVWRGSGIFIKGGRDFESASGNVTIRCLGKLRSCLIDGGGGPTTGNYTIPANIVTGDGWDVSNKGIYQESDFHHGDLILDGVEIKGFRGELQYQSGRYNGAVSIRNSSLHDSNASVLNTQSTTSTLENVHIYNSWQWSEGLAGVGSIWRNVLVENMAAGGNLAAGLLGSNVTVNGAMVGGQGNPVLPSTASSPWLTLDNVTFVNVRRAIYLGSYVRGNVNLLDSRIGFDVSQWASIHDVNLIVNAAVETRNEPGVFYINGGPISSGSVDVVDNIHLVVKATVAPRGRVSGYHWVEPFTWGGGLGPHVVVENSAFEANRYPQPSFATDRVPLQCNNKYLFGGDYNNTSTSVNGNIIIKPTSEYYFLGAAGLGGSVSMTTGGLYANGQVVRLVARPMSSRSIIQFPPSGGGMTLRSSGPRQFTKNGQELDLRYDSASALWHEIGYLGK